MSRLEDAVISKLLLKDILDQLDSDYDRLLLILNLLGWNYHELAQVIGCSHQNIAQILAKCRQQIKENLHNVKAE